MRSICLHRCCQPDTLVANRRKCDTLSMHVRLCGGFVGLTSAMGGSRPCAKATALAGMAFIRCSVEAALAWRAASGRRSKEPHILNIKPSAVFVGSGRLNDVLTPEFALENTTDEPVTVMGPRPPAAALSERAFR
jgi:hypothetical protein